jgi:hypothetical protein
MAVGSTDGAAEGTPLGVVVGACVLQTPLVHKVLVQSLSATQPNPGLHCGQ